MEHPVRTGRVATAGRRALCLGLCLAVAVAACDDDDGGGAAPPADAQGAADGAAAALDGGAQDAALADAEPDAEPIDMLAPDLGPVGGPDRPSLVWPAAPGTPGPHPILLMLHGFQASPTLVTNQFRLHTVAPDRGIIVAAPEGTRDAQGRRFWDAEHCCEERMVDDVAYLLGVVDELVARYDGDPENVWVFGHSNGGYMAHHLACVAADRVRGILPTAGLGYPRDRCDPARPVSVIQIHGDADDQVNIDGGGTNPGAQALVDYWAGVAGCMGSADEPAADFDRIGAGDETDRRHWTGCAEGVSVAFWRLNGVGHQYLPTPAFLDAMVDQIVAD